MCYVFIFFIQPYKNAGQIWRCLWSSHCVNVIMVHLSYVSGENRMAPPTHPPHTPITYTPHHLCHISLQVILQHLSVSFTVSLFASSYILLPLCLSYSHTCWFISFVWQSQSTFELFIEHDWEDIKLPMAKQSIENLSRLFFNMVKIDLFRSIDWSTVCVGKSFEGYFFLLRAVLHCC